MGSEEPAQRAYYWTYAQDQDLKELCQLRDYIVAQEVK